MTMVAIETVVKITMTVRKPAAETITHQVSGRGAETSMSYIYQDENGANYLRVVRTSEKQFPQFHWENGRWVKGKPAGPKIPYRLPELLAASRNHAYL